MKTVLTGFVDIKKQLSRSAILKIANAFCLFFIVRLAIEMTDTKVYGQWLTMLSILTWFSCIEVGFSRAIRNRITKLLEDKSLSMARRLTHKAMATEASVFAIIIVSGGLGYLVNSKMNIAPEMQSSLGLLLVFGVFYFTQFVLQMSNTVALANHRAEWPVLITFIQNILIIAGLSVAILNGTSGLFSLGLIFSIAALLSISFGSVSYFRNVFNDADENSDVLPTSSLLEEHKSDIYRFGIIQFFVLIIYTTDHIILQYFISSEAVTEYSTAFKYFNLLNVIFNLILIPFWSAFAKARLEKNLEWERKALKTLVTLFAALTIGGAFMVLVSNPFYDLWLGGQVHVANSLSLFMLVSALLTMWNFLFTYYLGGIGQVKAYAPFVILSGVINLPLSIVMVHYFQGTGVILSTCISLLPQSVFLPIIARKHLKLAI